MKRALRIISLLAVVFSVAVVTAFSAPVQAQKYYVVKGQVYDQGDKMSLPYAQVYVVGESGKGAVADIDGNYSLAVDKAEFTIEVRYMSYTTRRIEVKFAKGEEVKELNIGMGTAYQEMKSVEIKGQRIERDGKASVQSIEMVGVEQIAKNNVTTLDRALKNVAGLAIVDNEPQMRGGSGFSSGMGSRVMLLLDNMPMLRADAGRPAWNLVSMEDVEQIDVLKGAASVLYGSAAINGAINVHTKFATTEPKSTLKLYWGAYVKPKGNELTQLEWVGKEIDEEAGTVHQIFSETGITDQSWNRGLPLKAGGSLTHSRRMTKWWDFGASVDYAYDDGYRLDGSKKTFDFSHGNTDDEYRVAHAESRIRASLSNQFRINPNWTVNLNGNFLFSHNYMYNFWANAFDGKYRPYGSYEDENWATTLSEFNDIVFLIDPHLKYVSPKGGVHELDNRYMYSNNDVINIQGQDAHSQSVYNTYRYRKTFTKAGDLALTTGVTNQYTYSGGEVFSAQLEGEDDRGYHTADNLAVFFKLEKPFLKEKNLRLELGGRYELCFVDSWFESAPVFQFGVNYEVPKSGSIFRFSVGQGYRAATIGEKFIKTRVGMYGFYPNTDLESEKSVNFDLGYRQLFKFGKVMGYLDVSGFHQIYWNYIEFFMGPWGAAYGRPLNESYGFAFFNTGRANISGVEASLMMDFDIADNFGLQLQGNYTYSLPLCKERDKVYRHTSTKDYTYNTSTTDYAGNVPDGILKYRIQHMAKFDLDFKFWKIWSIGVGVQYMSAMRAIDRVFLDMDKNFKLEEARDKDIRPGWLNDMDMNLPFNGISAFMKEHAWGSVVLDLRTSVDLNRFTVSFVVNNVLNAEYSLRPLYIEAPLNFNIQVVYRFQDINPVTWFHRKKTDVAALALD